MWLVDGLAQPSRRVCRRSKSQQSVSPNSWAKTCCPNQTHEDAWCNWFLSKIWTCQEGRWSRWTWFNCSRPFQISKVQVPTCHYHYRECFTLTLQLAGLHCFAPHIFFTSLSKSFQFEANVMNCFVPGDCWLCDYLLYRLHWTHASTIQIHSFNFSRATFINYDATTRPTVWVFDSLCLCLWVYDLWQQNLQLLWQSVSCPIDIVFMGEATASATAALAIRMAQQCRLQLLSLLAALFFGDIEYHCPTGTLVWQFAVCMYLSTVWATLMYNGQAKGIGID